MERFSEGTIEDADFEARVAAAGDALAERLGWFSKAPDIVAVDDDRMAERSAGLVPLVVSGHFHHQREVSLGGTTFLRGGAASGGGLFEPFSWSTRTSWPFR